MTHTLRRSLAAAAAGALVTGLAAASALPAGAEVVTFTDKRNDGAKAAGPGRIWGDLGQVRVNHRERSIVLKALPAKGGRLGDIYQFWVDTDAADRGPEFLVSTNLEVEPDAGVYAAEAVGETGDEECRADNAKVNRRARTMRITFPRTCFGRPAAVRVIARTSMDRGPADWARDGATFGPWASRD